MGRYPSLSWLNHLTTSCQFSIIIVRHHERSHSRCFPCLRSYGLGRRLPIAWWVIIFFTYVHSRVMMIWDTLNGWVKFIHDSWPWRSCHLLTDNLVETFRLSESTIHSIGKTVFHKSRIQHNFTHTSSLWNMHTNHTTWGCKWFLLWCQLLFKQWLNQMQTALPYNAIYHLCVTHPNKGIGFVKWKSVMMFC